MISSKLILCIVIFIAKVTEHESAPIIGGTVAIPGSFPYQISLRRGGRHICGGSIYNERIIITAGHCVIIGGKFSIQAGSHTLYKGGIVKNVKKLLVHKNYNLATYESDVAVLLLEDPLDFKNYGIRPIKLANSKIIFRPGDPAVVSGWGATENGPVSVSLLNTSLKIIEDVDCDRIHLGISKNMFCAGDLRGKFDACAGDSGGPLAFDGYLIGIVSFGINGTCGAPGAPGAYAKISTLRSWIDTAIQDLLSDG